MNKRDEVAPETKSDEGGHIVERAIETEMRESYLDYSMSVIVGRALPDARDGLKPVQRRILYAMNEIGLLPSRPHKKSASVVGDVLGKYHPHGDSAVYETMVRMAQDFAMAEPLVDGQGNFGSIDGDKAAAYRYTEARLSPAAAEMLSEIDRGTVDFGLTFDDSNKEPRVLPSRLPNLLLNGCTGIAVGMSTNIPPFNLAELAAAISLLCREPDASDDAVYSCITGPDFPTGGLVIASEKGTRAFMRTGLGKMTLRSRAHVEREIGGRTSIVFTEIPYASLKRTLVEQIATRVQEKRIEQIADLRDESDRDGIRIVVPLKQGADPKEVLEALYRMTGLETTFAGQLLTLVDGRPCILSVRRALEVFIAHRLDVTVRRARFDLERTRERLHILDGLVVAIDAIEAVVALIRGAPNRDRAHAALRETFDLSDIQASEILALRLSRLTALDIRELREEISALRVSEEDLTLLLDRPDLQRAAVEAGVLDIAERFGRTRRTRIVSREEAESISLEAANEEVWVHVTESGRTWALPAGRKARERQAASEEDPPRHILRTRASSTLVLFDRAGRFYPLSAGDLAAFGGKPRSLHTLVNGFPRGGALALLGPEDFGPERSLVFVTRQGQIKRSEAHLYATPRSGGAQGLVLKDDDEIVALFTAVASDPVIVASEGAQAIRFPLSDVPLQGRSAGGVRAIRLRDADRVISAFVPGEAVAILCAGGYSKASPLADFPVQGRGGLGVRMVRDPARTGLVRWAGDVVKGFYQNGGEGAPWSFLPVAFPEAPRSANGAVLETPPGPGPLLAPPMPARSSGRVSG